MPERGGALGRMQSRVVLVAGVAMALAVAGALSGAEVEALSSEARTSTLRYLANYAPLLAKGTAITVQISVLSMALATTLGLMLALLRLYGPRSVRGLAVFYVEFMRGTPLLIQLYFIYYGLPQFGITFHPMVAAILGMGLNYAAYEAEIYRSGIMAIPRQQTEAALALGLTGSQAVRLVVLPQAVRLIIPPMTNDFVALFKDTSIVSVVAVVELTKTFQNASIATGRYMEFALVTALIYFALSFPLSRFARYLERRVHPHHDFDPQPA